MTSNFRTLPSAVAVGNLCEQPHKPDTDYEDGFDVQFIFCDAIHKHFQGGFETVFRVLVRYENWGFWQELQSDRNIRAKSRRLRPSVEDLDHGLKQNNMEISNLFQGDLKLVRNERPPGNQGLNHRLSAPGNEETVAKSSLEIFLP